MLEARLHALRDALHHHKTRVDLVPELFVPALEPPISSNLISGAMLRGSRGEQVIDNFKPTVKPRIVWSGRRESNPCPKLGKLLYCHCTTPAHRSG
jgi:hypothetical protein